MCPQSSQRFLRGNRQIPRRRRKRTSLRRLLLGLAAVVGLAKTLADELAPDKILVNSVCPGWILTERMSEVLRRQSKSEGVPYQTALNRITESIPLGRCGTAVEISDLIVFLASERASYITGATIQVDGGLCRGLF